MTEQQYEQNYMKQIERLKMENKLLLQIFKCVTNFFFEKKLRQTIMSLACEQHRNFVSSGHKSLNPL